MLNAKRKDSKVVAEKTSLRELAVMPVMASGRKKKKIGDALQLVKVLAPVDVDTGPKSSGTTRPNLVVVRKIATLILLLLTSQTGTFWFVIMQNQETGLALP
jgi:hypothetical protein